MSGFRETKRFIAGAVCPHCGAADSLRFWRDQQGQERRDCVACGWEEGLPEGDAESADSVRLLDP